MGIVPAICTTDIGKLTYNRNSLNSLNIRYSQCYSPCILVEEWMKETCVCMSHVAQVSDTAQVTRQVSLLGLIDGKQGREYMNTFTLDVISCM